MCKNTQHVFRQGEGGRERAKIILIYAINIVLALYKVRKYIQT